MAHTIKLLLADSDLRFIRQANMFFSEMPDIEVIGNCTNGTDLLDQIKTLQPDAVVMELVLSGMDGLSVLKSLRGISWQPAIIICTDFYNEICIRRARKCGASAFLCKPVCQQSLYDTIVESINSMGNPFSDSDFTLEESDCLQTECEVTRQLLRIGISQDSEGYRYLCDAVALVRRKPEMISSMTKLLYPELAKMNSTTPACAERNIRSAIQRAFINGSFQINGRKPTNKEMIAYLADVAFGCG